MLCWNCDDQARATCVICGRHVCRYCANETMHLLHIWRRADGVMMAVGGPHSIWCGRCEITEPVEMPELDEVANEKE